MLGQFVALWWTKKTRKGELVKLPASDTWGLSFIRIRSLPLKSFLDFFLNVVPYQLESWFIHWVGCTTYRVHVSLEWDPCDLHVLSLGTECLTQVAKFGPFRCTILFKSCLFYPSWQTGHLFWKVTILGGLYWGVPSVHENCRTCRTFFMARAKCPMRDFVNFNRIYKAHRTIVWWTMKVFRLHWVPLYHYSYHMICATISFISFQCTSTIFIAW